MNQKGFTLIELLAVITILGILMLVAIPAVSRTIENARRDTFASIAKEYINAVKNGVASNSIRCSHETDSSEDTIFIEASLISEGEMYFIINTDKTWHWTPSTDLLMDTGKKSPWGKTDLAGYIYIKKTSTSDGPKYEYGISLIDTEGHGIVPNEKTEGAGVGGEIGVPEDDIDRDHVKTKGAFIDIPQTDFYSLLGDNQYICRME